MFSLRSSSSFIKQYARLRLLSTSSRRTHQYLVAPPHPVSNLRPVLYRSPNSPNTPESRHPYALDEFQGESGASSRSKEDNDAWEEDWRALENDRFNHNFWVDCNTRFNAAKQSVIDSHHAMMEGSTIDPEAQGKALEASLSRFYKSWLDQEAENQRSYTMEMYRRNYGGILFSGRALARKWLSVFKL